MIDTAKTFLGHVFRRREIRKATRTIFAFGATLPHIRRSLQINDYAGKHQRHLLRYTRPTASTQRAGGLQLFPPLPQPPKVNQKVPKHYNGFTWPRTGCVTVRLLVVEHTAAMNRQAELTNREPQQNYHKDDGNNRQFPADSFAEKFDVSASFSNA